MNLSAGECAEAHGNRKMFFSRFKNLSLAMT